MSTRGGKALSAEQKAKDKNKGRLRSFLQIGELVFFLSERLKKQDTSERLHKSITENRINFNFRCQKCYKKDDNTYLYCIKKKRNRNIAKDILKKRNLRIIRQLCLIV